MEKNLNEIRKNMKTCLCINAAVPDRDRKENAIATAVRYIIEPPHGKTNNLHRRKQRSRSALR